METDIFTNEVAIMHYINLFKSIIEKKKKFEDMSFEEKLKNMMIFYAKMEVRTRFENLPLRPRHMPNNILIYSAVSGHIPFVYYNQSRKFPSLYAFQHRGRYFGIKNFAVFYIFMYFFFYNILCLGFVSSRVVLS